VDQAKTELRDRLNAGVFIAVIGIFFLINRVVPPPAILISERRAPASLPALSLSSIASGSFMSKFEDYAADRFAFRDGFRTIKAAMVFGVFMQTDKSGLYFGEAGAGEFKALDPVSLRQSAEKIRRAAETLQALGAEQAMEALQAAETLHAAETPQTADTPQGFRVYYSLIPDKSIYAGRYLPGFDLGSTESILAEVLGGMTYIPLADCLDAGSFYRTDLHWDQASIGSVVDRLCGAMGADCDLSGYRLQDAGAFQGVYPGQLALPIGADSMRYLDLPALRAKRLNDSALVFEDCPVYDLERFKGVDPYDMFLQGPQAIIELENPEAPEGDLYLFRDSYGSSLAPLLSGAYRRVTLIDLRYIDMRVLDQFVAFRPGADVLFLYSSQILNNPSVLKA
jgi:hypothetical protein